MFPNLVTIDNLDQSKIELGDNFLVAPLLNPRHSFLKAGELIGKFDGLNALFDYQKKYQPTPRQGRSSDRVGVGFNFFRSFNDAVDTYLNNPASITQYNEADRNIEGGESSGKELIWDVTGDFLDIGRYLEEEPECFGSLTNGNPRNFRVNIVMNLSWWHGVDKSVINRRASRIVRLVDWLESQGIRTSVTGIASSSCEHLEIIVKHFDEPLNLNDIAILGHSDFLRRIIFRFDEYSKTWESGYGNALAFGNSFNPKDWEPEYNEEHTIFVDGSAFNDLKKVDSEFDALEGALVKTFNDGDTAQVLTCMRGEPTFGRPFFF